MTEIQQQIDGSQRELLRSSACDRLSKLEDFQVFRDLVEQKIEEYRVVLEEQIEDGRSNVIRGGILALKDVLALFDTVRNRKSSLEEKLKELKNISG